MKKKKKTVRILITISVITAAVIGFLYTIAKRKKPESVYAGEPEQRNLMEGKRVIFVEDNDEPENADGVRGHLEAVGDSEYSEGFYERVIKRGLDVILSLGGLILLSPVMAVIAIAIKVEDPGPVLFTQKRVGQNKQYFKLHKFRSMKMNTPHDVPTHMLDNPEQYITKIGKFIRAHSLDELPQIWDIFIGNMSIIGPRPALWNQDLLTAERDKYGANDIKPGLTGWAQINGRDELEIPEKARLDGEYAAKIGLAMDARVFLGSLHVFGSDDSVVEGKTQIKADDTCPAKAVCHEKLDLNEHKKILIAGATSYIGTSFREYLSKFDNYIIDSVSVRDDEWKNMDFSVYDVVYDVAGITHVRETDENRELYYEVNRDLAYVLAKKAKAEGVKQFIYMSSMSVYGLTAGRINEGTQEKPVNAYGKSKLEAEKLLWSLQDDNFVVSIVRPPMVYGEGCKGNYQTLRKFALRFGFFPEYNNARSMIYIDNLSAVVRGIVHNGESGIYYPQDPEYTNTYEMVRNIATANGKKFYSTRLMNGIISIMAGKINVFKKVFGTLTYDKGMNVPTAWMERPLVSILTVSYNSAETISRTIESVLNQTYPNIEYIIIDGASGDGTADIARSYQEQFDNREGRSLIVISEPDRGMYDALNKGARMAHGVLVGQTNADDYYEHDAVETMVDLYLSRRYDVAWGSINVIKPSGNTVKHAKLGRVWTTSGWCHPAMFTRREILLETPYICESMYDDFDFITSVHQQGKLIVTTDKVISNFSFGGMSTKKSLSEVKKRVDILYKVYRRHGLSRLYYLQRWAVELVKYLLG